MVTQSEELEVARMALTAAQDRTQQALSGQEDREHLRQTITDLKERLSEEMRSAVRQRKEINERFDQATQEIAYYRVSAPFLRA